MSEAIRQMLDKNLEVVLEFLMPVRLISVAIVIVVAFVLWKIIRKYINDVRLLNVLSVVLLRCVIAAG